MKRFIKDTRGSAPLWAAFIAVVLCMLSVVAYTGATLYSTYRTAQTEMERAASISVDRNMENRNVRDLVMDIPQEPALADMESNLALSGWVQDEAGIWKRLDNGRIVYELRELNTEVHDGLLDISGLFVLPLPWRIGGRTEVKIPIATQTKVVYLE